MEKGYFVSSGYMGFVQAQSDYQLFASESDYLEFVRTENATC